MYRLRELAREDIQQVNIWRNDSDLISMLGSPYRFINIEVDYKWYDEYMSNRNTAVRCVIVKEISDEKILGIVSLVNINHVNRTAEFYLMIGEKENRGKGIGYFATTEILKHAFLNLNLNRVELCVLEENMKARSLYKKAGFIEEGFKRQAVYKNGMYHNMIIMSILRNDYTQTNKN